MGSPEMHRSSWRTPIVILVCGTVVALLSFGIRTNFGLFLKPITEELGWGREAFATAIGVQMLLWGLAQPFAGAVADKYGAGRVIAVGGAMYALGVLVMAQTSSPLDFTLGAGVLVGLGLTGTGFPIILAVIGRSVEAQRRSLFLGLAAAGGSSGQVLMVPLGQAFLDAYGWMTALGLLAALSFTMVPLAAALAGRPKVEARREARQGFAERPAATAASGTSPPAS